MSESIKIAGRDITVKQLKMNQIREFVSSFGDDRAKPHILDILFDDPVPAKAVSLATGLSMEELAGDLRQDEMRQLLDKVKAVNPSFVGMMERIIKAGQLLNEN